MSQVRVLNSTFQLTRCVLTLPGSWGDHLCWLIGFIPKENKPITSLWQEVTWQLRTRPYQLGFTFPQKLGDKVAVDPEDSPLPPSERTNCADTLILNFYLPELWDNTFLLFRPFSFWYFVQVSAQTNPSVIFNFSPGMVGVWEGMRTVKRAWLHYLLGRTVKKIN